MKNHTQDVQQKTAKLWLEEEHVPYGKSIFTDVLKYRQHFGAHAARCTLS